MWITPCTRKFHVYGWNHVQKADMNAARNILSRGADAPQRKGRTRNHAASPAGGCPNSGLQRRGLSHT